jgi:AcrR family transcriptional regulator
VQQAAAADVWTSISPASARRLLLGALDAFSENGYGAATTRDIATRAGLSPAGVYLHYRSKAELLYEISKLCHTAALAAVEAALESETTPVARVEAFVRASTTWHARNHKAARVIQYELRGLEGRRYREILPLRQRFEELLRREIEAGKRCGAFSAAADDAVTHAVLSLSIDVARWYRPSQDIDPELLGAIYGRLAVAMLTAGG